MSQTHANYVNTVYHSTRRKHRVTIGSHNQRQPQFDHTGFCGWPVRPWSVIGQSYEILQ